VVGALISVEAAVVYRNGELTAAMIDRGWPHQVALPSYRCTGHEYLAIHFYCEGEGLLPARHIFRRDDVDMLVFCFADHDHALAPNSSIQSAAPSGPARSDKTYAADPQRHADQPVAGLSPFPSSLRSFRHLTNSTHRFGSGSQTISSHSSRSGFPTWPAIRET